MHVVNSLEDARAVLKHALAKQDAHDGATSSRSPLAGEPNPPSDLVGGHKLTKFARDMRKDPTPWERKLWNMLKGERLGRYKFRRQVPIDYYIVDFVNFEKRLIIELDGSHHADSAHDEKRDAYLRKQGFQVLRFWNNELDKNPNGLLERIFEILESTPHRNAQERFDSPAGGEWEPVEPTEHQLQRSSVIHLCSPPFAACHAGVNYYRHLLDALTAEFTDVDFTFTLCCGDDAAIAHDALRRGFSAIRCDCPDTQSKDLQVIAAQIGAKVNQLMTVEC